jgi:hypothetical protein
MEAFLPGLRLGLIESRKEKLLCVELPGHWSLF